MLVKADPHYKTFLANEANRGSRNQNPSFTTSP